MAAVRLRHLADVLPDGTINSPYYVVVFVADDPSETDGDPLHDSASPNPGAGVVALRAEAFGLRGSHKVFECTVAREDAAAPTGLAPGAAGVRVLSWREVR